MIQTWKYLRARHVGKRSTTALIHWRSTRARHVTRETRRNTSCCATDAMIATTSTAWSHLCLKYLKVRIWIAVSSNFSPNYLLPRRWLEVSSVCCVGGLETLRGLRVRAGRARVHITTVWGNGRSIQAGLFQHGRPQSTNVSGWEGVLENCQQYWWRWIYFLVRGPKSPNFRIVSGI